MTATKFDRDQLLRRALQPAASCPPLAELVEAEFTGATTSQAEALRVHAASCSACAAELELAGAFDATPRQGSEAEEIAWVADQLHPPKSALQQPPAASTSPTAAPITAPTPPTAPLGRVLPMNRARSRRPKGVLGSSTRTETPLWKRWAAAALVLIGLGFAFEWSHRNFAPVLPDAPDSDVVRSGELLLDSPLGTLNGTPNEFTWRPVVGAAKYRIELRDVAGDLLWQGSSATTALSVAADLAAKLETFVTYRWNVTALDDAESALAHSSPASFRIEPLSN